MCGRNRKKGTAFQKLYRAAAAGLLAAALAGCGSGGTDGETIVVPKETEEAGGLRTGQAAGLSEQLQAPDQWQDTFQSEKVTVTVDAPVIVPDTEGFRVKKVIGRAFTQEDYDAVSKTLFDAAALWDRDADAMSASNGFTKREIEERIAGMEEERAGGVEHKIMADGQEINYEEELAKWKKMLEAAPEEAVISEIPAVVKDTRDPEQYEQNDLNGYVTVKGRDYAVYLDNTMREDWNWPRFEADRTDVKGTFLWPQEAGNVSDALRDAAGGFQKEAEAAVKQLGIGDFAIAGAEYGATMGADERKGGEAEINSVIYGIHFTRRVDQIPVTYTHQEGTRSEEDTDVIWPYEELTLAYDEKGLARFSWSDPYQVEDLSGDYVFLLPFSDIQKIFEQMMQKKYEDLFAEEGFSVNFRIDEIRLGYMRIRDKENAQEGTLVPVWDFLGSQEINAPYQEEKIVSGGPYESWLTINAMDGTVIDRELGY